MITVMYDKSAAMIMIQIFTCTLPFPTVIVFICPEMNGRITAPTPTPIRSPIGIPINEMIVALLITIFLS